MLCVRGLSGDQLYRCACRNLVDVSAQTRDPDGQESGDLLRLQV